MKNLLFCGAAVAATLQPVAAYAQQHTLADDAAAFGAREAVVAARLSPDGSSVIYLTPGPGPKTFAVITNLATGKSNIVVSSDGSPESLRWCNYAAPTRAVCRIDANVDTIGYLLTIQRLMAMDTSGGDAKLLGQPTRDTDAYLRQFDGSVLDWRGGVDGRVLMQRQYVPEGGKIGTTIVDNREGLGVDLVDTATLRASQVEKPNKASSGYMTDGRGNVRVMSVLERTGDGDISGRTKYFYRTQGSRDWRQVVAYQKEDFEPLAIDADLNALYALKKKDGRKALYRIKLDGSLAESLVAEHSKVDIDDVVRSGDGQRVIGYAYEADKPEVIYFDAEFKALGESLARALPKSPIVRFVDATMDGRKLLLFAGSDNDPGRFYLFDRAAKSLNEAMVERPELEGRALANVKPVTITVASGIQIPGYLTVPPGSNGKGLPAVILPHGGPSARDSWGFDWISQFLAARGYAVLQPQYRGSAGFGEKFQNDNALKNWRTAMNDIAASARWLAAQGISDPQRTAIVGWSYGGYSALQSAETNPELYKAVVAIAPVTDFELLKLDAKVYSNGEIIAKMIGSGPEVAAGSPLQNAGAIRVPVLLAHGDLDTNVAYHHSQKMYDALKSRGKDVEFLSYRGLDHQLRDATVRTQMLTKVGALLERTIGH